MALPKHILVLNSGCRTLSRSHHSESGEIRLHFREITRIEHCNQLQGMVFHDVVWVRRLPWDARDREEIEWRIQVRVIKPTNNR